MKKGKLIVRPLPPPRKGQPLGGSEWTWRDGLFWALLFLIPVTGIAAVIMLGFASLGFPV